MKRRTLVVWVGFSDGVPHFDSFAEGARQPGYSVFKSRRAAAAVYEDVRPMRLAGYRAAQRDQRKKGRKR